jgi:putative holliday junction resolvase
MRRGRRLAIDVGRARIGLALCDPDGILASPLEAIMAQESLQDSCLLVLDAVKDYSLLEIYVGEPISLSGSVTQSTIDAQLFAKELSTNSEVPVRLVDERLTTVSAASKLRAAGKNSKNSRNLIDSASAVEILEAALNFERLRGEIPGIKVGDDGGS